MDKLKALYDRQMAVQRLIAENKVAIGMTMVEVGKSRGEPTKTTVRKTKDGQVGVWEYIDYEEVKNYVTRVDPVSGFVYRQIERITRAEQGTPVIAFVGDPVTAFEESEHRKGGQVRILVPPIDCRW